LQPPRSSLLVGPHPEMSILGKLEAHAGLAPLLSLERSAAPGDSERFKFRAARLQVSLSELTAKWSQRKPLQLQMKFPRESLCCGDLLETWTCNIRKASWLRRPELRGAASKVYSNGPLRACPSPDSARQGQAGCVRARTLALAKGLRRARTSWRRRPPRRRRGPVRRVSGGCCAAAGGRASRSRSPCTLWPLGPFVTC
jgi:hypothetical protein